MRKQHPVIRSPAWLHLGTYAEDEDGPTELLPNVVWELAGVQGTRVALLALHPNVATTTHCPALCMSVQIALVALKGGL